eukprot:6137669-Prymnesium_polylepis.4
MPLPSAQQPFEPWRSYADRAAFPRDLVVDGHTRGGCGGCERCRVTCKRACACLLRHSSQYRMRQRRAGMNVFRRSGLHLHSRPR